MAILTNDLRLLIDIRKSGVDFGHVLTVGRPEVFLQKHELRELACHFDHPDMVLGELVAEGTPRFADYLFKALGAKQVTALDFSDFEGAEVVHDLNEPLPGDHHSRYDFVFDTGTLEHVFNFPEALRGVMQAVKVGGRLFITAPISQYCGHGFYSLSPELFYRTLSPENGFAVERMLAYTSFIGESPLFSVRDPDAVKSRVEITSDYCVLMLVQARRLADVPIFAKTPQQSDYSVRWSDSREKGGGYDDRILDPPPARWITRLVSRIPGLREWRERHRDFFWRRRQRAAWMRRAASNPHLEEFKFDWLR